MAQHSMRIKVRLCSCRSNSAGGFRLCCQDLQPLLHRIAYVIVCTWMSCNGKVWGGFKCVVMQIHESGEYACTCRRTTAGFRTCSPHMARRISGCSEPSQYSAFISNQEDTLNNLLICNVIGVGLIGGCMVKLVLILPH